MTNPLDELSGAVKGSWHRFLDVHELLRPNLYRYHEKKHQLEPAA